MTANESGTSNVKAQHAATIQTMPDPDADSAPDTDGDGDGDSDGEGGGVPPEVRRQLVNLRVDASSHSPSYLLRLTDVVNHPDSPFDPGGYVDIMLDEDGDDDPRPMLVVIPISEDEQATAINARKITGTPDTSYVVRAPTDLLAGTEYDRGLDLDLERYSNENQLLFEPLPMEGVLGLSPVVFEDGTEYERAPPGDDDAAAAGRDARARPAPGPESDPDPEGVPGVPAAAIDEASATAGVDRDRLEDALTTLAVGLDAAVLRSAGVVAEAYDALEHDDAVLYVLDADAWDVLGENVDGDVRAAVELAHLNAGQRLVQAAGAKEYRRFSRDHAAVVLPSSESE